MSSMSTQLGAAALRFAQLSNRHAPYATSKTAQERRAKKFLANLDRHYVHTSRAVQFDREGKPDFAHKEFTDPRDGLVKRVYPKGVTYNVGRNAAKRRDRRADVRARVEARRAH